MEISSDEEQDWMIEEAQREARRADREAELAWQNDPAAQRAAGNIDDEEMWIDPVQGGAFQEMLQNERHAVRARPEELANEALNPQEEELDRMVEIMDQIAEERGVDIGDLDGHFALDPDEGNYRWVDHEDVHPIRRSGSMGRFNKRIRRTPHGGSGF